MDGASLWNGWSQQLPWHGEIDPRAVASPLGQPFSAGFSPSHHFITYCQASGDLLRKLGAAWFLWSQKGLQRERAGACRSLTGGKSAPGSSNTPFVCMAVTVMVWGGANHEGSYWLLVPNKNNNAFVLQISRWYYNPVNVLSYLPFSGHYFS